MAIEERAHQVLEAGVVADDHRRACRRIDRHDPLAQGPQVGKVEAVLALEARGGQDEQREGGGLARPDSGREQHEVRSPARVVHPAGHRERGLAATASKPAVAVVLPRQGGLGLGVPEEQEVLQ